MSILNYNRRIKNHIKKAENVFLVGHKDLDLDAIGSCLGMYQYVRTCNTNVYIVIDDKKPELGVKRILEKIGDSYNIISSKEATKKIEKRSLLIILDTNKEMLLQNPKLLKQFRDVIVIDHHGINESTIGKGIIIIDFETSSTCEMITEFLSYNKISFSSETATSLLSGIVLDTNNYVLKTTSDTFKISHFLCEKGADMNKVQYLLKQDLKDYIARQKVITDVKLIKDIAITKGSQKQKYRREDLAKIADTLFQFSGIEASFVVGKIEKDKIGISARSVGNIDVGKVLEILGGGGNSHEAATKITGMTLKEVYEELKRLIKML